MPNLERGAALEGVLPQAAAQELGRGDAMSARLAGYWRAPGSGEWTSTPEPAVHDQSVRVRAPRAPTAPVERQIVGVGVTLAGRPAVEAPGAARPVAIEAAAFALAPAGR